MCKRPFLIAAVLLAAVAHAQQFPSPTPGGDNSNPLGRGNSIDCSDPLMAQSSLCTGDLNSATLHGGFNAPGGSRVPSPQQNQVVTYTDDAGRPASRESSTTLPLPSEPLTEFQKFTAATTGIVLPIFGADLFQSVPSTFAPLNNAPVPPDYVVGPDDEVRVRVWGQVNFNANLHVDR